MNISLFPVPYIKRVVEKIKGKESFVGTHFGFVLVVEKAHDHVANTMHEREHIKQWWLCLLLTFALGFGLMHVFQDQLYRLPVWVQYVIEIAIGSLAAVMHYLLYIYVLPYRLWAEVQAFKQSIKHGRSIESAARWLASDVYRVDITFEQAMAKLIK